MNKDIPQRKTERPRKGAALGKGFNSLLGLEQREPKIELTSQAKDPRAVGSYISKLQVAAIDPNPKQPRRHFRPEDLSGLAKSIEVDGIIQPILVSKQKQGERFTLVAGERRWRAAQMAGLTEVPCIIKEHSPEELLRVALIENIQRADLNVIEEALAYGSLMNEFGLTQEQCAQKVGKDRSTITNTLRLLGLPNEIQQDIIESRLSMGHGRAVLALSDTKVMLRARDQIIKSGMNVRQTENLCKSLTTPKKKPAPTKEESNNADLQYVAESLRGYLRTKVKIKGDSNKGSLEISYFSSAELQRILQTMGVKM
jgi:ParB family transcriptional regulator, chromosome partitioning protein